MERITETMTEEQKAQLLDDHRRIVAERYEQLPPCNLPTRENTVLTYPSHDHRMHKETHKGIMHSFAHYIGELEASGYSDIGLARNKLFNGLLRTPWEWMILVDTDIGFRAEDMAALLEWKGPRDYAVNGVYLKKNDDREEMVTRGLGFARVHRNVLEAIRTHIPMMYREDGYEMQDFCPTGVTGNGGWLREDTGFWFLCAEVGVHARLLYDINLIHYDGRRGYKLNEMQKRIRT